MNENTEELPNPLKNNSAQISTEEEIEIEDSENNTNSSEKEENPPIKEMTNSAQIPPLPRSRVNRSISNVNKPIISSSTKSITNSVDTKTPISSESSPVEENHIEVSIPGIVNDNEEPKNFVRPVHPLLLRKKEPTNTDILESSSSATSQHLQLPLNRSINISHNIFEPLSVRNRTRSSSVDAKFTTQKSLDISLPMSNTFDSNNSGNNDVFNFGDRMKSVEMIDYVTTNAYKTSITLPNNYTLPTPRNIPIKTTTTTTTAVNNNNNNVNVNEDKNSFRTTSQSGGSEQDLANEENNNIRNPENTVIIRQRSSTIIENRNPENLSKCITNYKSNNKSRKEFNNMKIIQDLEILDGSITCMSFSEDGKYTAFGCQNSVIYVFSILKNHHQNINNNSGENINYINNNNNNNSQLLFYDSNPTRVYTGHTGTIVSISWSSSLFILSSSKDNTMKLWNIKLPNCLHTFRSNILNICLDFQPNEDQFFISGSIDGTLKLWQLPDAITIHWIQLPNMITYCKYTNNGKMCCIGLKNGDVLIYLSQNLKYVTRIEYPEMKKKKSKKEDNEDVIGISFFQTIHQYNILISTIDNLIRCYDMTDYKLLYQFKNLVKIPNEMMNRNSNLTSSPNLLQMQQYYSNFISTFNNNMKYVISASNTKTVLILNTKPEISKGYNCFRMCSADRNYSFESFDINDPISQAMFVPDNSLQYWNNSYIPYSGSEEEENAAESGQYTTRQKMSNTIIAITNNGHVKVIKAN